MANSLSKLSLCMELGDRLPPESELVRWLGEPIKTLLIPTSLFLTNKKGYPVLPKPYQVPYPHIHHSIV
jgi:protein arginine N-methyltransferase 5